MNSSVVAEKAADKYACEMGFGKHIVSGLKKAAGIMPEKFDNNPVKDRIKIIEGACQ